MGTNALSAKTAWNLRRKLPVSFTPTREATVYFTVASKMLGGDLNGTNSVNVLDYAIMKSSWFHDARGDINGDGGTNLEDYSIMNGQLVRGRDPGIGETRRAGRHVSAGTDLKTDLRRQIMRYAILIGLVLLVLASGGVTAAVINVPTDQPTIKAAVAAARTVTPSRLEPALSSSPAR